ncbi:MAG: hypothetical protein LBD37_02225 [Treponema sp.]|jgi:hypothetical protein|nr:hypothetical protein [Treponema sp.]
MRTIRLLPAALPLIGLVCACATAKAGPGSAAGGGAAPPASVGTRYYERTGGFSLCLPESWEAVDFPGLQYQVIISQGEDETARPNITFYDEPFQDSLGAYVDAVLEEARKSAGGFTLVERGALTAGTVRGERVIIESNREGRAFRQFLYFFPGPGGQNRALVATATVLAGSPPSFDALFDETMKTFEWVP